MIEAQIDNAAARLAEAELLRTVAKADQKAGEAKTIRSSESDKRSRTLLSESVPFIYVEGAVRQ